MQQLYYEKVSFVLTVVKGKQPLKCVISVRTDFVTLNIANKE